MKTSKGRQKIIFTTGKRKTAVARARIAAGSGKAFVNSVPIEIWGNEPLRLLVKEPLLLAGDVAKSVDVSVKAKGGGISGQAEAARMAIAKGLVDFTKNRELRQKYLEYDRNMLVYDPRRTEPHHAGGASKRGSRRHKQRSKR